MDDFFKKLFDKPQKHFKDHGELNLNQFQNWINENDDLENEVKKTKKEKLKEKFKKRLKDKFKKGEGENLS